MYLNNKYYDEYCFEKWSQNLLVSFFLSNMNQNNYLVTQFLKKESNL